MVYGILSDIHSNLEALNAVLVFFKSKKVKHYACSGDIVGYGPNPNECTELIKTLSPLSICVGNHDRAVTGLKDLTWFNEYAKKSLVWTSRVLTESNKIYLSELPKMVTTGGMMIVHGSPRDPLDEYLLIRRQYEENLPHLNTDITLVGHTHVPFIFGHESTYLLKDSVVLNLEKGKKYIINPGSVGQPRDGNNKASCAIYDSKNRKFTLYRLEYDISSTQSKMREHKLPAYLIERLNWGK